MFAAPLIPVIASLATSMTSLCLGLLAVSAISLAYRWLEGYLFSS